MSALYLWKGDVRWKEQWLLTVYLKLYQGLLLTVFGHSTK